MEAQPEHVAAPKPKRRWFQFSLATLLLLTLVCALVLALWVAPAARQRRAVVFVKSPPDAAAVVQEAVWHGRPTYRAGPSRNRTLSWRRRLPHSRRAAGQFKPGQGTTVRPRASPPSSSQAASSSDSLKGYGKQSVPGIGAMP